MKTVILEAFGGLLRSGPMAIDSRLPSYDLMVSPGFGRSFAQPDEISLVMKVARFRPTDRREELPSGETAHIYALEEY